MTVAAPERPESLRRVAAVIKCVGHPLRLRLLQALQDREDLTVSELQEITGEHQATVSRQLAVMRARQVVEARRDGINVHYRIVEPSIAAILECVRPLIEG